MQSMHAEWTAFLNKGGNFELYADSLWRGETLPKIGDFKPGTLGYIPSKLGYQHGEWYTWLSPNSDAVIFKSFTKKPICVLVSSDEKPQNFSHQQYEKIISTFDYDKDFKLGFTLKKKIRQSFLEDVIGHKAVKGILTDSINGYKYSFENGYLSSAESLDGLSETARSLKGSRIFSIIEKNAEAKHYDRSQIIDEINAQCWYFANLPEEYVQLAENDVYNYNFALIWFALYGVESNTTLKEFLFLVPDAQTVSISQRRVVMNCGANMFVFQNDVLTKVY